MRSEKITQHIDYICNHCKDFINEVHEYMVKENWCWYGKAVPPSTQTIRVVLYDLLQDLYSCHEVTSAGFKIKLNEDQDRIEVYFGHFHCEGGPKIQFRLYSKKVDPVEDFIDYVVKDGVISREYLEDKYEKMKRFY